MAEIGAIASIIGVAGAGAKLSIVLFEFASTVGSAGLEVRQIGIDISLFCSVLKQLQSTLTKAKAYRYSISAIETTQEILDRCQEVFGEIEGILRGLQKGGRDPSAEPSVDLIARVKWTFKRSKVQVLRATLESCKIMLHIMLTTLEFAQKIATRRVSTVETQAEDEHEQAMTHSLIIAHQCSVDTLMKLEDEEYQQLPTESGEPSLSTTGPTSVGRVVQLPARDKPLPWQFGPTKGAERKRASIWLNDLIFDKSPLPPGFRRQTWGDEECTKFLELQPYYFLQKWTDQGWHRNEIDKENIRHPPRQETETGIDVTGSMEANPSTTSSSSATPLESESEREVPSVSNSEIFKSFRVSPDDPTHKIIPAALKRYNINAPPESYSLWIVYEDKERCLESMEKPLVLFNRLLAEGKKPMFMLRKLSVPETLVWV
ncbi:hypothetical protein OIDMADRAFT_60736 [Oidiodendron maius Zn]|uniref:Ras-associating domain-containing protein n=1 Tax=Oidiodendron maius (strain Zn) TaxID=913774 RepID=A0A0C3GSV7_OIDMZ|nr:hypothetical protein OIDMADRAFT_60736 [Oidiodendron maius Zn]